MSKSEITTIGEAYQKMCGEAISLFEKQQKRIAELEKEVQHLSDEAPWIVRYRRIESEQIQEMREMWEENNKLKEQNDFYEKLLRDGPVSIERIRWIKKENNKLRDEVEQLRYKLKDEVAGWSPTSSPEPKMNN